MTIFILFISMIINIVSIFAIIILYQRQNRVMNIEKDQKKALEEIEEIFSSYIIEIKDENEEFVKKLKGLYTNQPLSKNVQTVVEQRTSDQKAEMPAMSSLVKNYAEKTYQTAMKKNLSKDNKAESPDDFSSLPIEKQAELLEKEGLSVQQIAQKLHKGVTEIELLLKFRQKM